MRNIVFLTMTCALLCACHESLEERAAREAREFTEKNCPVRISELVVTDSMTFEPATSTIHYYMTVNGRADTTDINKKQLRADMVESIKGATNLRVYKEAGFGFCYTFFSQKHPGEKVAEVNITKKDY